MVPTSFCRRRFCFIVCHRSLTLINFSLWERSLLAICILMYGVLAASCVRDVEINLGDLPDRIVLNASVSQEGCTCPCLEDLVYLMDNVANFDLPDQRNSLSASMASFKV